MNATFPVWPFAILAGLLFLDHRQSSDRVVRPGMLVKVAIAMLALSLLGVTTAFGANPVPLLAWAAGFTTSMLLGGPVVAPRGLAHEGDAVRVPGSWVPLGLMLGIFSTKFAVGFGTGIGAPFVQQAWFIAAASTLFGLLSGAFAARAAAVHRFVRAGH